jgi:hypothetical protein
MKTDCEKKMTASWDMPCSIVEVDISEVHTASIIALMMEAVGTYVTSACFETTRHFPRKRLFL